MSLVGVGFRGPLAGWIETRPPQISCLEIVAEHFFDGGKERLRTLAGDYPLMVHGLGLSLGTPGPLDEETLGAFARVVDVAQPLWVSEHIAFTKTGDVDLGHLNPVHASRCTLDLIADHARQVSDRCGRPIVLENIATHLQIDGEMRETEFLNQLCEMADCGLLIDLTNLYVNARNHCFDPQSWLRDLDPARIVQLHIVGFSERDGRFHDLHAEAIQEELWALVDVVADHATVQAAIIERDHNFDDLEGLGAELTRLEKSLATS